MKSQQHTHQMDGRFWPARCKTCGYVNRLMTRDEFDKMIRHPK